MRTARHLFVAGLIAVASLGTGCGSAPDTVDDGDEQDLSLPQSQELLKYLETVMASGTIDEPGEDVAKPALSRLERAVGPQNLTQLMTATGQGLGESESQVIRVTRPDKKTALLSFKSYATKDGGSTLGLVNVEDANGAVQTFAERDVVQAQKVVSTLFTIDKKGVTRVDNLVHTKTSPLPTTGQALPAGGLHIATDGFGSPAMCNTCKTVVAGIKLSQPMLVFLITHHIFSAACVGVGIAAGAGTAIAAAPTVVGEAAVPAAALGGYRGCRLAMAGISALILASATMPASNDESGKTAYCNKVAAFVPGGTAWCVDHGPESCGLSVLHASTTTPVDQCVAVARCAHDSKCPEAQRFCGDIFLGTSASATASRAMCAKIDAVACGGSIQSDADLQTACRDLTQK